jgi:hypothetical protein
MAVDLAYLGLFGIQRSVLGNDDVQRYTSRPHNATLLIIRWRVCGPIQRGYQTSRNTVFHREPSAWHDKQPLLPRHSDPSLFCDTQRILLRPVVLACVRVAGSSYGSVGSSCQAKAENSGSGALPLRAKLPLIAAKPCQPPKWTPSALLSHFVARLIVKEISVDLWICQCWVSSRRTTGCPS